VQVAPIGETVQALGQGICTYDRELRQSWQDVTLRWGTTAQPKRAR